MAEIYRDSSTELTLGVSGATSVSANVAKDGVTIFSTTGDTFTLPFSAVAEEGTVRVNWTFTVDGNIYNRTEVYEIVTPYVTLDEIKGELVIPEGVTDETLVRTERRVRKLINVFTNQTFGKRKATYIVRATAGEKLRLPERLLTIDSIAGNYVFPLNYYRVDGDGRYIGLINPIPDDDIIFNPVIQFPYGPYTTGFTGDYDYTVTGTWGWDGVPEGVREATLILIEQELCPNNEYRDKLIKSVTYAETDMDYFPSVQASTGSVTADRLLSEFKYLNWAAI